MEEKLKNLTTGSALIIGAVLTAIYYFAIYDDGAKFDAQIVTLKNQITTSNNELTQIKKALEDAERFQQTMKVKNAEMEKVLKALPAKLNSLELMRIISNEAKSVGADINRLTAGQVSQSAPSTNPNDPPVFFEAVPVEIEIKGAYNQIMLFLSNLTKLDKIVTAKKMKIVSQPLPQGRGASLSPEIVLTASLAAYRFVSPPPKVETSANPGGGTNGQ